jgi:hypothetical protein
VISEFFQAAKRKAYRLNDRGINSLIPDNGKNFPVPGNIRLALGLTELPV